RVRIGEQNKCRQLDISTARDESQSKTGRRVENKCLENSTWKLRE
ncbi:hypothetical protein pipiens_001000, partial [Culex pipiens pipiens]